MNIAIINHNPKEHGTYFRCFGFAKELVKMNHHVYFFCLNATKRPRITMYTEEGINFVELPFCFNGKILGLGEHVFRGLYIFFSILFKKTDIVHSFNVASPTVALPTLLIYLVKSMKQTRLIVDWDDWWGKGGLTTLNNQGRLQEVMADFLETRIPLLADKVTFHNNTIKARAMHCGVQEHNLYKIYNGANLDTYQSFSDKNFGKAEARKELALPKDKYVLFFGGAVVTSVPFLLRVMEEINDKNILLLVIGPIVKENLEIAEKLHIKNNIKFVGKVSYNDYKKYILASDVLLLPRSNNSLLDRCTFPGRLGDYMLSDRPIVASDVGELSLLFREDRIGLLAKSDDVEDFRDKILTLIENKIIKDELSNNAFNLATKKYNWETLTRTLVKNVYRF